MFQDDDIIKNMRNMNRPLIEYSISASGYWKNRHKCPECGLYGAEHPQTFDGEIITQHIDKLQCVHCGHTWSLSDTGHLKIVETRKDK